MVRGHFGFFAPALLVYGSNFGQDILADYGSVNQSVGFVDRGAYQVGMLVTDGEMIGRSVFDESE